MSTCCAIDASFGQSDTDIESQAARSLTHNYRHKIHDAAHLDSRGQTFAFDLHDGPVGSQNLTNRSLMKVVSLGICC